MFEDLLALQNPHWTGQLYEGGVIRTCFGRLLDYLNTGQVVAITGVRRAGKSTLLKQLINYLIKERGEASSQVLFLNLEHPYLSPYREDPLTLQRIWEDYLKLLQPTSKPYVFLDEVQFLSHWPLFVKAHHETKQAHFVVTGSNAAMLSSDMMTLLSGRSLPMEVFPFSFRELAQSRSLPVDDQVAIRRQSPTFRHLLETLLETGGFPIVAAEEHEQSAFDILGAHARTVLLQDVAPRLSARKPVDLEKLYVYLVSHIGKLFSYSTLSKLFDLSDKSVKEYVQALTEAFLIYEVDLFSYSLKKQLRNPKKIYAIDTGQANAMGFKFSANRGRLLENLMFIDLKRLQLEVFYYKTAKDHECDFVAKMGTDLCLIQVAWDLRDPETRERELRSLLEAKQELSGRRAICLTLEEHAVESTPGITQLTAYRYFILPPAKRKELLFSADVES